LLCKRGKRGNKSFRGGAVKRIKTKGAQKINRPALREKQNKGREKEQKTNPKTKRKQLQIHH
jgi:hypothetical protein